MQQALSARLLGIYSGYVIKLVQLIDCPVGESCTMLTITLDDQTTSQLTKMAAAQSISPEDLIEKAIRELLRAEASRILARETEAFRAMHDQLLKEYAGQYVAIHQGQLVDHDPDQFALYLRMDKLYPDEILLIKQVSPVVDEVYTIRSPRLIHA